MTTKTQPTKSDVTDLGDFESLTSAQEEGVAVQIQHPATGADLGITIVVAGPDSDRHKQAQREMTNVRLRKRKMKITAEEVETESRRLMARKIISWEGVVYKGEPVTLTVDNAIMVFQKFPFIYEQLDAEAGDRASFFKS